MLTAAGCAGIVAQLNSWDGDIVAGRPRLEPIPVSPKVCPYVRVMHAAANDFQRVSPINVLGATTPDAASWPARQTRLKESLDGLELGIVVSRPYFPARIRERLGVVLASIRSGRPQVDRAGSDVDLIVRAADQFQRGQYAFGDASDLVGDACAVHLAAGPG